MKTIIKEVPKSIRLYSTLTRCCRYQSVLPSGVQPVFSKPTCRPIDSVRRGFAVLPEKQDGAWIYWTVAS